MQKEAKARIKINELLKNAGWIFFDDKNRKANIVLENNTEPETIETVKKIADALGVSFDNLMK